MYDNTNPDSPVSGNWLANTYAPAQTAQPMLHTVGYSVNPFGANGVDPSRRNMVNNPAWNAQPTQQMVQPMAVQPFSTYPQSTPAPSLNQFVMNNQNSGNTAALSQNNPWAQTQNPTSFTAPMANPVQPLNMWNYQMTPVTPTVNTGELINQSCSWDKKNNSWNFAPANNFQAPLINWNQYSAQSPQNGYYAPLNTPSVQPQYPGSFVTTPVNADWTTICETNFKQQF